MSGGSDNAALDEMKAALDEALAKLEELQGLVKQPVADADRPSLENIQARADSVMISFGDRAPVFMAGEKPIDYRRRLASMLQKHSKIWKGKRLESMSDEVFGEVEKQVYADALQAALHPSDFAEGEMRPVRRQNEFGHFITEFVGKDSFVKQFGLPPRRARIRDRSNIL